MKNTFSSREREILLALAKNARLSDRELASKLKTSQPTITRLRSRLMNEKYIDRFVILPNLAKLGLHFWVMTTIKPSSSSIVKKMVQWMQDAPSVLFATEGEGPGMHSVLMESIHADFAQYQSFIRDFREKFSGQIGDVHSFYSNVENVSKYYHWHGVLENRLLTIALVESAPKLSRSQRLRHALENIPNPLERISNPLRGKEKEPPVVREGKEGKDS
ncbi:MAG: Lrp/AsnC family transcriptional regulator [Candidatus Diapherotrites archaeon]